MHKQPLSKKKRVLMAIVIAFAALTLLSGIGCGNQWMLFYDKPITGYVVEAETGKPIENVIVVSMWRLSQFLSQGFGGYAKIILVKTDRDGKFKIPFWMNFKPWKFNSAMHVLAPEIVIYKPGYKLYFSHKIEREGFPMDISTTEEEKQKIKETASLTPAKLKRIYTDEEIWESYLKFRSEADLYIKTYSIGQFKEIYSLIRNGAHQLPEMNKESKEKILNHIRQFDK